MEDVPRTRKTRKKTIEIHIGILDFGHVQINVGRIYHLNIIYYNFSHVIKRRNKEDKTRLLR